MVQQTIIPRQEPGVEIDKTACHLAQTWHGGEAGPKYKGISVGDLIAYELMQWFIAALKISPAPPAVVSRPARQDPGRGAVDILKTAYERLHAGRNALHKLPAVLGPGFRRFSGLRCVLFDPYVGYELLLPRLFGSACAHIVIPRPNLRAMPRIRYYQGIFKVPTGYFHSPAARPPAAQVSRLQKESAAQLDNVWEPLRGALREYCGPLIQKACIHIDAAESIISKYKVDATVLPYDELGLYKALALVGRRDGLLTIVYQHGAVNRYAALIPPTSEQIIAWDENARARFYSWGVTDRKIVLLPNPMVPLLQEKARLITKETARKKLGLAKNRPVVFFAGQPFTGLSALDDMSQAEKILYKILDLSGSIPEVLFLIKLHPNDTHTGKPEKMRQYAEETGLSNVMILASGDSHELMLASDMVISGTSTCLWEATVLGRVAVTFIDREFTRYMSPYDSDSGILRANSIEELAKIIRDVSKQPGTPSVAVSRMPDEAVRVDRESPGYFDDPRWEMLSLIPSRARTLLDVGCGAGWLGEKIKATRPCFVAGIEKNPDAARLASKILDEVFVQDIEKSPLPFHGKNFDCIVINDLLEHLVDPWQVLRSLVELLRDNGVVVLSIPNIGHYTTLLHLFAGHFRYKSEGILDKTHLRFFTREGIEELLGQSGLRMIKLLRNTQAGRKMRLLNFIACNRFIDQITFQYIIVADRSSERN